MKAERISPKGPGATRSRGNRAKAGTTLVEVLVVIVVLAIGILAVVQIFPGGLRILNLNRNAVMATAIGRDEAERVIGRAGQIPEAILPVQYVFDPAQNKVVVNVDSSRRFSDLGINNGSIDGAGNLTDAGGHPLGYWPLLSGPNLFRRIQGEGSRVPPPRQVGDFFGGLMVLQFTPIIINAQDPAAFDIYGADMTRLMGPSDPADTVQPYEYYVDNPDQPSISLEVPADTALQKDFRIALSYYVTSGTGFKKIEARSTFSVPADPSGALATINLDSLFPGIQKAEFESIRLARKYEELTDPLEAFSDAYQYRILDPGLGVILFSPQASQATEARGGRRVPLEARVDYDVVDWRVMRDEFRVPDGEVPRVKLALGNLKVKKNRDVDNTVYPGLNVFLPKGDGSTERRDLALMDLETGGVILDTSATRVEGGQKKTLVRVDRSNGILTFVDADGNVNNGLQGELVLPGASSAIDVNLTGRSIRAMYQARGEWAVQVMKAPNLLTESNAAPSHSQFYVGGSDATLEGSTTRIYFSQSEAGQRVTIDEIYYHRKSPDNLTTYSMPNQSFVIQSQPADPTGLAYVDITSVDPDAEVFDTNGHGYAVRGVRGASVTVRVLWNPAYLALDTDPNKNLAAFDVWGREWRRQSVETYVRRPGE